MPLSEGNSSIEEYLAFSSVTLERGMQNDRIRHKNNILLNVYSGDRIILVEKFSAPLPRRAIIVDSLALVYYKEQSAESPLCPNCSQIGYLKKKMHQHTSLHTW